MSRTKMLRTTILLVVLSQAAAIGRAAEDLGIRVPEGFEVTLFADDDLAHDIYAMTLDARGRVVVSGAGYVKTLHDRDGDGRADEATLFSPLPKSGAHGMIFLGDHLLYTGDDGLWLLRDLDRDGVADGRPERWANLRIPEHGANGLVQGPDGWIYLICGNDAGVSTEHANTVGSPIHEPQSGAVLRFSPDGKQSEIVAEGFRNPYDLAFNSAGALFTVDADGERDHHLPWYSPTRLFDIAQGMHHGWVLKGWQRAWNRPAWFFDNVERLAEIGRGSPTGVEVYRHRQFPAKYRDGVFSCCWTLGRVYHFPLRPVGASYQTEVEVFLETTGEVGFAPVDMVIGPEGDLFVAVGGRRTRGSVFRVRYTGGLDEATKQSDEALSRVLAADQPLAAWSRANWEPQAHDLGVGTFVAACLDSRLDGRQRLRAIEILTESFQGVDVELAEQLLETAPAEVLARVAWALGRRPQGEAGANVLLRLTSHDDSTVQRAAWEAIQTLASLPATSDSAHWSAIAVHPERRVRSAAMLAYARRYDGPTKPFPVGDPTADLSLGAIAHYRGEMGFEHFDSVLGAMVHTTNDDQRLLAVRLLQLSLGDILPASDRPDVFAGYTANDSTRVALVDGTEVARLDAWFPSSSPELNLELTRLFAMLRVAPEQRVSHIAAQLTESSVVLDDLHYLTALAQIDGPRSEATRQRIANALLRLHTKMRSDRRYPSRNWPLHVSEVFEQLCQRDERLPVAMLAGEEFGLPEHGLFVLKLNGEVQLAAASKLISKVEANGDDEAWTTELVEIAGLLPPDETLPLLRGHWTDYRLRDAIVRVLAEHGAAEDRSRFIEALGSPQPEVVQQAAEALSQLPSDVAEDELAAALRALRQYCSAPQYRSVRESLAALLTHWTEQRFDIKEQADLFAAYQPWFDWFTKTHPEAARRLAAFGGTDAATWQARLESIDWSQGDLAAGKQVFEKQACHRCHLDQSRLGPDLARAAARFSRDDLFAAIVNPSLEVSPLYQTSQIVTGSGKVYYGLVVYESPDATLLQTTPDETIRIAGDEIVSMHKSNRSLMPEGLLNGLTDNHLADLYVYLRSLR